MAKLANRIQNALDEARILILGAQILFGFELRSFFEPGFETLPEWARVSKLAAACVMLAALALVMLPTPYHRLVERGEDGEGIHRVATRATDLALAPFALGLGLDVLVAALRVADVAVRGALAAAGAATATAVLFWYVIPAWGRRPRRQEVDGMERAGLDERIRQVLTEARMVLPGAQAMLGFQLSVTLMESFQHLPRAAQRLHAAALLATALAVVLLIAPAAYHRIAEEGDETERFERIAGWYVVAALVPLALSMSADLAVVTYRLTEAVATAAAVGGAALAVLAATWFGFTLVARAVVRARPGAPARSVS